MKWVFFPEVAGPSRSDSNQTSTERGGNGRCSILISTPKKLVLEEVSKKKNNSSDFMSGKKVQTK
jgi:hypothetical protein